PAGMTLADLRTELTSAIRGTAGAYGLYEDPAWDEAVDPFANIPDSTVRALPPQYFQTGSVNLVAPPSKVRAYADALSAAGQPSTYDLPRPGQGHDYLEWYPETAERVRFDTVARPALDDLITFLDGVFAP
ncbi:MAG: hypothetical protein AAF211_03085, partial [Myxococcota bacterium]